MHSLLSIPVELAHHALSYCPAWDIVSFALTCRLAHATALVSTPQAFWRDVFLTSHFDDPREAWRLPGQSTSSDEYDWLGELRARLSAELFAARPDRINDPTAYEAMLATFVRAAREMHPFLEEQHASRNGVWLNHLLKFPGCLNDDVSRLSLDGQRLHAFLQAYTGHAFDESTPGNSMEYRRNASRAYAYDMRKYSRANTWSPLLLTGEVDWLHLDHLANVVIGNLRDMPSLGEDQLPPLGLEHTRAYSGPGQCTTRDWAGVQGTWRRYVCFMDYRSMQAPLHGEGARQLAFFDNPAFREAVRLLSVELEVVDRTSIEAPLPEFIGVYDNPPADFPYPPIFFVGTSETADGGHLHLEGCVMMGIDGTVRWYFISSVGGEFQWSSRGVQLGGVGSATGVVGVWTTTTHEVGDPAGPYWQWKVPSDDALYAPLLDRV
ncbi:hypothetical protein HDZ31DRAFT_85027 [Schizophyllum fasciatum]